MTEQRNPSPLELSIVGSRIKSRCILESFLFKLTPFSQLLWDHGILLIWNALEEKHQSTRTARLEEACQASEMLACLHCLREHCLKMVAGYLSTLLKKIC